MSIFFIWRFRPILAASMLTLLGAAPVWAQVEEDVQALNRRAIQLHNQGKRAEAFDMVEQALSLAENMLGREHQQTFRSVSNLGFLYRAQGRYAEAEPLYLRALAGREKTLGPMHPDTLSSANGLGTLYQSQGRYAEAESLLRRALAGYEQVFGPEHANTLLSVSNLGGVYRLQGRYAEAEPLLKRALAGYEAVVGPDAPDTLQSINNLAALYQSQGRYAEAEPLFKRGLAGNEKTLGLTHPDTLQSANNLGILYSTQGHYAEAELHFKRALAGRVKVLGPEHPSTLRSVNNLGGIYDRQGRYAEAELLYKQALAGREKALGPEHQDTLLSVNNLSFLYSALGRYAEAEPLLKRALAGYEKAVGPAHPDTLTVAQNLGALYDAQRLYAEAEPFYRRALAGREKALGPEHPDTLASVNNLGAVYQVQRRHAESESLLKRALAGNERVLGPAHPDTLQTVNNLAVLYQEQSRSAEAELLFKRALAGCEKALGPAHPDTLRNANNLSFFYSAQGRYAEAEPLLQRALAGYEAALGPEHPATFGSINNLAALHFAQGDWPRVAELWRRSTAAIAARTQRGIRGFDSALTGKKKNEAEQFAWQFWGLAKVAYRLGPEGRTPDAAASREIFETAQWALSSEAAEALAQMATRGASGNSALGAFVRERQDLMAEWQKREQLQSIAFGHEPAKRNAQTEAENNARMIAIGKRIGEIDTELAAKFPEYAALANPAPLSVEQVQDQLGADEALILLLDTPEAKPTPDETFIWVVTKTNMRWVRSDLGRAALTREVQGLRCGLDYTAWKASRCKDLTGADYTLPLPFDHARAHRLYKGLFGQVDDLIKGKKHLLLVPSGALTQLPFQVLITTPPAAGDHRTAAWLARSHALTVLPAVSSLKALRATVRRSAATKSLIGFANPLLDGPDDRYAKAAKLARDKQNCPKSPWERVTALLGLRNGAIRIESRGGLANVSLIRKQAPLPETADELCAVARDIGADAGEMRLGSKATEREVKAMSARGELAKYHIIHFATHGLMAGQLSTTAEPGLILTPPEEASAEDDGYLSASEVAALKLDADWVILSACNTAAGDTVSAEALSGLARAFIYAQARALLVSHWEVYSEATVKLISGAMREMARDKTAGRAEALRRAMLALIDKGEPQEAHPAYWAPFIVVGEGSR